MSDTVVNINTKRILQNNSGGNPPIMTEYVTKSEFDSAVFGINHRMDALATKESISHIETDLAVLKATMASKADKSDIGEAKTSIIMWVVSAIFLAQLLPIVKDLVIQSHVQPAVVTQTDPPKK